MFSARRRVQTMMHPLTGFALLLLAVVLAARLDDVGALLVLLGVSLALMLSTPHRSRRVRQWLLVLVPLAVGLVLVHGRWIAVLLGMEVRDHGNTFEPMARLWLRIAITLAFAQWWLSTTSPEQIVRALLASRLPPGAAYLLASPLLLAEQLKARLAAISEAQAARGVDVQAPWHKRWRILLALALPLLLWTLSEVGDRAAALEARAFRSRARRTTLDAPLAAAWERVVIGMALVAALLIMGSFGWR